MNFNEYTRLIQRHVNAPNVSFLQRMGLLLDVVHAEGAVVRDAAGREFIDCIAGYGNCVLGHNPKPVVDAVVAELTSARPFNLPFVHEVQALLAERLAKDSPGDLECSFIVNSGSEAVETALKLARLSSGKPGIVCTRGSWHGFSYGCLSISEQSMCRQFKPFLEGVSFVEYGNPDAIESVIDEHTGCVIIEPIQSENGAVVPPSGYLSSVVRICARRGVILIFDEVKTGIAKTGRLFACNYENAVPDILVCGKALGGGVMPVGAVVAKRSLWGKFGFSFPMSSSSGAGNAPACAAALATLRLVESDQICQKAELQGNRLISALGKIQQEVGGVLVNVSGRGLLVSLQFESQKIASEVVAACAKHQVLVMNAFCDRTKILIEPPACISDEQVDAITIAVKESIKECSKQLGQCADGEFLQ
jgi:putrescine aminotransferase